MARRRNVLPDDLIDQAVKDEMGFEEAIEYFIDECEFKNLSDDTVKYYRQKLIPFARIMQQQANRRTVGSVTRDDIRAYIIKADKDRGLKTTTINAKLRAIRAFYNCLYDNDKIPINPVENLSLLKQTKPVIETFSKEQLRALFAVIDRRTFTGVRDYTIINLFLETGVRLSELVGIKTHHVKLKDGYVRIANPKGDKERIVPIQRTMRKILADYLRVRGDLDTDALFVTIDNTPLSARQIQNDISDYGELAGIKNVRCSPHTFRHTFAKMSVQNGANLFELQLMLGHTTLDMVRTYVNLFSDEVAKGHSKFSPLEGLTSGRRN